LSGGGCSRGGAIVDHYGGTLTGARPLTASLSVVLPIRDAQENLADFAAGLLEVLPDLTARFEILFFAHGASDATLDQAHELARDYPQVRLLRHGSPVALSGIVQTTLLQTRSAQIVLCDEGCRLEPRDLHKLWGSRDDFDAVLAWPAGTGAIEEEACGLRVRAWRLRLARPAIIRENVPGYQLLHRRVLETLRWTSRDRYELLAELSRHGFRWQVVEVRRARRTAMTILERAGESMRVDERSRSLAGPNRPMRAIDAIKEFALGE
jgi:hypothetical protein